MVFHMVSHHFSSKGWPDGRCFDLGCFVGLSCPIGQPMCHVESEPQKGYTRNTSGGLGLFERCEGDIFSTPKIGRFPI